MKNFIVTAIFLIAMPSVANNELKSNKKELMSFSHGAGACTAISVILHKLKSDGDEKAYEKVKKSAMFS